MDHSWTKAMKFENVAIFFVLGMAASITGVWVGDRNPATESIVAEARPPFARASQQLKLYYEYRRYRLCPRETQRTIFDGQKTRFDLGIQSRSIRGPIGGDSYLQPVLVPEGAAPGQAVYRVTIYDYCNTIHYLWPLTKTIDIKFTILPP